MSLIERCYQHKSRLWFLMRYGISGALAGGVQTFILYVWVSILGLQTQYLRGVVVGFCTATIVGFSLQKYWTFAYREQHYLPHQQFIFFILLAFSSLGLNVFLLRISKGIFESIGLNFFHIWYLVAEAGVILCVAALSFFINYLIIFRSPRL